MVGKSQIKFIKSLQQKKYRSRNGMFVVEGTKTIKELLGSDIEASKVYCSDEDLFDVDRDKVVLVSEGDLSRMSGLKSPSKALGVFLIPRPKTIDFDDWILVLDNLRDPGNLGTIIRLCDWFGISQLVCSPDTVDCYNPKVLQATMGSIARVNVVHTDLASFLAKAELSIFGTFMGGHSVYETNLPQKGIMVMGNEANGISPSIEALVHSKIGIPRYGDRDTESLNVATATAIFLNEIRRP